MAITFAEVVITEIMAEMEAQDKPELLNFLVLVTFQHLLGSAQPRPAQITHAR